MLDDITTRKEALEVLAPYRWERDRTYSGTDFSYYFVICTKTRDESPLGVSNFRVAHAELKQVMNTCILDDYDGLPVFDTRTKHFACGWYDSLMVNANTYTPILIAAAKIARKISDYCVLDEDDLSNAEREANPDACVKCAEKDGWERAPTSVCADLCPKCLADAVCKQQSWLVKEYFPKVGELLCTVDEGDEKLEIMRTEYPQLYERNRDQWHKTRLNMLEEAIELLVYEDEKRVRELIAE